MKSSLKLVTALILSLFFLSNAYAGTVKGIYVSQTTLENKKMFEYLITRAKRAGINTFVVDLEIPSKRYENNIALLKANNINYVARIIVFPNGGNREQLKSEAHREKKFALIKEAIRYGASEIQLDYIRYSSKQPSSPENSKDVVNVIRWFKEKMHAYNLPLQVDVFGIIGFAEEKYIGQNIKMIGPEVDAVCPMVYPSHFEPYRKHAVTPYETVYDALAAMKDKFDHPLPFKLYPYIELSNYRYPLSQEKRIAYIQKQLKAVQDVGADGWYAWSAANNYDNLFFILENQH